MRELLGFTRISATISPPMVSGNAYQEPGSNWYQPLLAGPSTFVSDVTGARTVREALGILSRLQTDKYSQFVIDFYKEGLKRFGDRWVYADINTVLLGLARRLNPSSYLEIGVRRGRSMAMVASAVPDCCIVGFDLWLENYAGMDNPGAEFVASELRNLGYRGEVTFIDGDSKKTVPAYFAQNPEMYFDIITVDGDHSLAGARQDLTNVLPRVKVGGAIVFDDIAHSSFAHLARVWQELVADNPQFESYEFTEVGFGTAFALRKY